MERRVRIKHMKITSDTMSAPFYTAYIETNIGDIIPESEIEIKEDHIEIKGRLIPKQVDVGASTKDGKLVIIPGEGAYFIWEV